MMLAVRKVTLTSNEVAWSKLVASCGHLTLDQQWFRLFVILASR